MWMPLIGQGRCNGCYPSIPINYVRQFWRHVLFHDAISVPLYILFDGVEVKSKLCYEKITMFAAAVHQR